MAILYPEIFPHNLREKPHYEGESILFEALKKLDNSYIVYYSAKWQASSRDRVNDFEMDFLVLHKNKGILVFEVKGGEVRFTPNSGKWTSITRGGSSVEIKDPYEQSKSNKYALINLLKSLKGNTYNLPIGHIVCFPHTAKRNFKDSNITVFLEDLDNSKFESKLHQLFNYYNPSSITIEQNILDMIKNTFATPIVLEIPLSHRLNETEKNLITLTEKQFEILTYLQFMKKAIILGSAGTGKTILAIEKAKILSEQGKKVLFLCYNKPLSENLKNKYSHINIEIYNFLEFCDKKARESNLIKGNFEMGGEPNYFNIVLPELLKQSIQGDEHKYDAIIIDEGQDFLVGWWDVIKLLFFNYEKDIFYIFSDNYQSINNDQTKSYPIFSEPIVLTQNKRNTNSIFNLAKNFYRGELEILPSGITGLKIKKVPTDENQLLRKLKDMLTILIKDQNIMPHEIGILEGEGNTQNEIKAYIKEFNFCTADKNTQNSIVIDTIRRFKGLERKVIIVLRFGNLYIQNEFQLLYVAFTRATTLLILMESERVLGDIDG